MPAQQARHWVFTLNNPDGELPECEDVRYVAWQAERGENGTLHWQGYVEMKKKMTLTAMKRWLPTAHFEPRRGTREEAKEYAMKELTRVDGPWERGTFENDQGSRTDIKEAVQAFKAAEPNKRMKMLAENYPEMLIKYPNGFRALNAELTVLPEDKEFVPRQWQQDLLTQLALPPDDRKIIWVTNTVGNAGKTRLARHLLLEHGAIVLSGRMVDMQYAYNGERIVIFDVSRAQAENLGHLYAMAEHLKGGQFLSTKYESRMKVFTPPHVVFMANVSWEREKFSHDRMIEINV